MQGICTAIQEERSRNFPLTRYRKSQKTGTFVPLYGSVNLVGMQNEKSNVGIPSQNMKSYPIKIKGLGSNISPKKSLIQINSHPRTEVLAAFNLLRSGVLRSHQILTDLFVLVCSDDTDQLIVDFACNFHRGIIQNLRIYLKQESWL